MADLGLKMVDLGSKNRLDGVSNDQLRSTMVDLWFTFNDFGFKIATLGAKNSQD